MAAAIRTVLDNPQRARQMGAAGRQRVEDKFSWASVAERTEQVYREAIEEFKRSEKE